MTKPKIIWLFIAVVFTLLLSGCGTEPAQTNDGYQSSAPTVGSAAPDITVNEPVITDNHESAYGTDPDSSMHNNSQVFGYWADIYEDDGYFRMNGFHFAEDGTGYIYHSAEGAFPITSYTYANGALSVQFLNMERSSAELVVQVHSLSENEMLLYNDRPYKRVLEIQPISGLGSYVVIQLDGSLINIVGY